jgi:hypothetical protein
MARRSEATSTLVERERVQVRVGQPVPQVLVEVGAHELRQPALLLGAHENTGHVVRTISRNAVVSGRRRA